MVGKKGLYILYSIFLTTFSLLHKWMWMDHHFILIYFHIDKKKNTIHVCIIGVRRDKKWIKVKDGDQKRGTHKANIWNLMWVQANIIFCGVSFLFCYRSPIFRICSHRGCPKQKVFPLGVRLFKFLFPLHSIEGPNCCLPRVTFMCSPNYTSDRWR